MSDGTDLVGLVAQQEHMRQVAGAYDGFQQQPGLAASLVSAGVSGNEINAVGGFVKGLQLSNTVTLARQSGVTLDLSDEDRGLLSAVGTHYDDVDRAQQGKHWTAGSAGTLATLSNWANNATNLPVIKQGFSALNRAADIGGMLYRNTNPSAQLGAALGNPNAVGEISEQARTMQEQHYDPDLLGTLSFYSRGKLQFHNLDDLRHDFSPEMVDDAKRYLVDPAGFLGSGVDTDELIRRDKMLQDPRFKSLMGEVDGRHISPGRDLANGLALRPGTAPFNVVSGSADALYSWYADPTLILGKVNQGVKQFRFGLGQLSDTGRIEDLMRGNRAVRNGWTQMLEAAKVMRSGSKEDAAAAYARVRASTPDLLPVLDEIHGGGLREGRPITTYDDLVKHVVGTDALVRLRNGIAAREAPLMPGALSKHGYGAVKGALAAAGTRHGVRTIDLTDDAGRMLADGSDAFNAAGEDISGIGRALAAAGGDAAAVGETAAKWRSSARGRAATTWNRMTTLLPEHSTIDLRSGQGAEDVRRFAALFMPRAHANALASRYAVASLGERRAIAEAVYEQVMHSAGLPSSTSGRAWLEAERSKRALEDNSAYDNSGQDLDRIAGTDGEAVRRNALYLGQTSTHFLLPNVVALRRLSAKVSVYDHVARSAMESPTLDTAMSVIRNLWLINPASAQRQIIEAHAASAAAGLGPVELARNAAGLSTVTARRAARRYADLATKEVDSEFRPVAGTLRGWMVGRVATNMRRAEAAVGGKVAGDTLVRRATEVHDAGLAGDLTELKALTGFGTRGAHQSIDEAKEILDRGYQVGSAGMRRAGWHLDSADGLGGAKYWSDEFGRRFAGSDGQHVLRATLESAQEFANHPAVRDIRDWWRTQGHNVPTDESRVGVAAHKAYMAAHPPLLKGPRLSEIRDWWRSQGHPVPTDEGRISLTARLAYGRAHPPRAREALVQHLLSDDYASARAVMERFSVLRDGTKVGDNPALLERAARELADDQIVDMKSLITGRDGKINPELAAHLQEGPPRRHPISSADDPAEIGGPPPGMASSQPRVAPSVSFLHSLGEDARPERVIQPKYVADVGEGGKTSGNLVQALGRGAYDLVVSRPMQHFASLPIFGANYARAYKTLEPIIRRSFDLEKIDPGIKGGIERMGAAESGEDFTRRMQDEIIRDAALQHAMDATVRLVDNPRVQTQMSLVTRNMFNFWRAQEDFGRRWGRILKENPEALRKGQLIVEGGMHSGFVYQDEQGQLVFAYPGSGHVIQAVGKTLSALGIGQYQGLGATPNLTTKLQFLNSGLDRPFIPSTSPVASIPMRVIKHYTGDQVGMIQGVQITEGSLGAGRSWWAQFLPSPVYRVMASQSKDEREGQYASAMRNSALNLYAAGLTPPDGATPDEQQDFKNRIRTGVRNQLLSRALLALVLPGAPGTPTEETDASRTNAYEKAAFNSVTLSGEYKAMVNRYGPQKALAVWTAAHPDQLIYTVASTEGGGYISPTNEALSWLKSNKPLVGQYKSLAAYFSPTGPGDFSQDAWQVELELGLRKHKDLDTFYRDIVVKNAESSYYNMRDKRDALVVAAQSHGDTEEVKRLQASFSAWSGEMQKANPLLLEKWQAGDLNKTRIAQLVSEVEQFAGSDMAKKYDPNGDLPRLVDAYRRKTQFDDTHKGRTNEAEAQKSSVDHSYKDYVGRLLGRSPYLLPLYRGVYDKVS